MKKALILFILMAFAFTENTSGNSAKYAEENQTCFTGFTCVLANLAIVIIIVIIVIHLQRFYRRTIFGDPDQKKKFVPKKFPYRGYEFYEGLEMDEEEKEEKDVKAK